MPVPIVMDAPDVITNHGNLGTPLGYSGGIRVRRWSFQWQNRLLTAGNKNRLLGLWGLSFPTAWWNMPLTSSDTSPPYAWRFDVYDDAGTVILGSSGGLSPQGWGWDFQGFYNEFTPRVFAEGGPEPPPGPFDPIVVDNMDFTGLFAEADFPGWATLDGPFRWSLVVEMAHSFQAAEDPDAIFNGNTYFNWATDAPDGQEPDAAAPSNPIASFPLAVGGFT